MSHSRSTTADAAAAAAAAAAATASNSSSSPAASASLSQQPSSAASPPPSSSPSEQPGYPNQTFHTEILPCLDPVSSIAFHEAEASSSSDKAFPAFPPNREPFQHVQPVIASDTTSHSLHTAAQHLRRGHLVAFPTETVYGLGASALHDSAARKIYAAKKRPADNPLIVHVSDLAMLRRLLPDAYSPDPVYTALMRRFWPGALTLLFPVEAGRPKVPDVVTCGQPSVAVRMPSHPIARALIALSDLPLAAPSANASGRPSPTTAAHVMSDLGGQLDAEAAARSQGNSVGDTTSVPGPSGRLRYILDGGPSDVGLESTVVDGISTPGELRILRPGGVTVEEISQALSEASLLLPPLSSSNDETDGAAASSAAAAAAARVVTPSNPNAVRLRVYGKDLARSAAQESNPTTPGMKYRHYSPTAQVVMLLPSHLFSAALGPAPDEAAAKAVEALPPRDEAPEARTLSDVIRAQLAAVGREGTDEVRVGLMTSRDSALSQWAFRCASPRNDGPSTQTEACHPHLRPALTLSSLPGVVVHPFDLGPTSLASVYAQRMFDGLRTLDEATLTDGKRGCRLIFVEALHEGGVGLAVMNRLKKASSRSVVVDC